MQFLVVIKYFMSKIHDTILNIWHFYAKSFTFTKYIQTTLLYFCITFSKCYDNKLIHVNDNKLTIDMNICIYIFMNHNSQLSKLCTSKEQISSVPGIGILDVTKLIEMVNLCDGNWQLFVMSREVIDYTSCLTHWALRDVAVNLKV